jgi:hypothetical protein
MKWLILFIAAEMLVIYLMLKNCPSEQELLGPEENPPAELTPALLPAQGK